MLPFENVKNKSIAPSNPNTALKHHETTSCKMFKLQSTSNTDVVFGIHCAPWILFFFQTTREWTFWHKESTSAQYNCNKL